MNDLENVEDLLELDETPAERITFDLATVTAVTTNGIRLKFDGDTESGGKVYKCNSAMRFDVGDRVKVHKESGSYIVEYVISAPMEDYPIPTGGTQGQVLRKRSGSNYDLEWGSISSEGTLPTGGTQGQILRKKSGTDYDTEWQNLTGTLPTGGTTGQALKKKSATNYDVEWKDVPDIPSPSSQSGKFLKSTGTGMQWDNPTAQNGLPSGGTTGQYLAKSGYTDYSASWVTPPVSGSTSTIGFMGTTASSKKAVNKMSTYGTPTVDECRAKINELLTALSGYGLINSY